MAFFIPHAVASLSLAFLPLHDRHTRHILLICLIATGLSLILIPFTNTLASLSIVHGLLGLALGLFFPYYLGKLLACPLIHCGHLLWDFINPFMLLESS